MKAAWPSLFVLLVLLGCDRGNPNVPEKAPSADAAKAAVPVPDVPATEKPSGIRLPGAAAESTAGPVEDVPAERTSKPATKPKRIRRPAVAGMFYPSDKAELTKTVDGMLAEAKDLSLPRIRALICPHAGYEYSGKTAALAYRQVREADIKTVILLGPPHTTSFVGAAVADVDGFSTPLGVVTVSPRARELAAIHPYTINPGARIEARDFARRAPLRSDEVETPHTWEHSLEVQLPFLQRVLPQAQIVPVVVGQVDPSRAARILGNWVDDQTLVIVSTDLSHYRKYEDAKKQDAACVKAICDLDASRIHPNDACGSTAVKVLIELAKERKWKPQALENVNSGDTTGDKSRVVGYTAIAFCESGPDAASAPKPGAVSAEQRKALLKLARDTLVKVVNHQAVPKPDPAAMKSPLTEDRACFVTLTRGGQLRGCIGCTAPEEPLYQAVVHKTEDAALRDPRFPAVTPQELSEIDIEISVLTIPKKLDYKTPEELLKKLRPHIDGVLLRMGQAQSVYLPQVWEQLPDKEKFMNQLAIKAGRTAEAWREAGTEVLVYQVEAFKELKN